MPVKYWGVILSISWLLGLLQKRTPWSVGMYLNRLAAISDWRQKKNRSSYFSGRYVPLAGTDVSCFNVGIVQKSYERKK